MATVEIKEGRGADNNIADGKDFTRDPEVIVELLHGELGEHRTGYLIEINRFGTIGCEKTKTPWWWVFCF